MEALVHLFQNQGMTLGVVISIEGIVVDLSKVQEVLKWKSLRSVTQICSFLILAGYNH
jgi:hypothetical protein